MAGRKTFTAGEVLQAADVNDFLMDQSVMVFAGTAARGSAIPSPTEGMVTYRSDDDVVEVYNGSSFVPVGPGQILQVVSVSKLDSFSTTSSSLVDVTGLTASITPTSTSSKILVSTFLYSRNASVTGDRFTLARNGTSLFQSTGGSATNATVSGVTQQSGGENFNAPITMTHLDSPASTSSLTYAVRVSTTGGTLYVGRSTAGVYGQTSSITLMEVAG